ncbi:MAG: lipocalin-like domain-containing protein [Bacteroides sp.]|nr:lipocalin-like domain-containing protein [Bacteroides sp.]MCM1379868.1 lipocalin-like domain-containing protein [Bacteroides sp.]MCM1446100.1 lipocalin-like domain-containing protein [Prevotella sp.]
MRILKYLILAAVGLTLGGCMQHNGRIGDWFGTWKLTSIEIDGASDTDYQENIFFQFQTDIVCINQVNTEISGSSTRSYGRWSEEGTTLTLDFSYTAENQGSQFMPPAETLLGHDVNILGIEEKTSRKMVWTYQKPESGQTITYTLKKQ